MLFTFQFALWAGFPAGIGDVFRAEIILLNPPSAHRASASTSTWSATSCPTVPAARTRPSAPFTLTLIPAETSSGNVNGPTNQLCNREAFEVDLRIPRLSVVTVMTTGQMVQKT